MKEHILILIDAQAPMMQPANLPEEPVRGCCPRRCLHLPPSALLLAVAPAH